MAYKTDKLQQRTLVQHQENKSTKNKGKDKNTNSNCMSINRHEETRTQIIQNP